MSQLVMRPHPIFVRDGDDLRPIAFRGPALLDDMKSRPYPSYAFYDLLYSEEQILAGEKPKVDPAVFKDRIVFVGVTASGVEIFTTSPAGKFHPTW